jgi:octanoyl-[GcvH]:protein N-octanoyltransferase
VRLVRVDLHHPAVELSPVLAETLAPWPLSQPPAPDGHGPVLALVRRQRPYVLLGPKDLRLARAQEGVALLDAMGYPVYARLGGGSMVLLDEDCLSFALAVPCRNPGHVQLHFELLTQPVRQALEGMGVAVRMDRAPGSYCEGPSDLVEVRRGRKVAGVAQAVRAGYAMVSGMILVRQDPSRATALVAAFERAAGGSPQRLRAEVVTSLQEELGRDVTPHEVADMVQEALGRWAQKRGGTVHLQDLTLEEYGRARLLLPRRRLAVGKAWRRFPQDHPAAGNYLPEP